MTEKFKKIDRQYVLSDSSVNEYGFRLLTSGYQLDDYQKNPIGYYMHRRDEGIAVKWTDLRIEDDKVVGTPVINLCNSRGEQICNEAENGFLNAASVGHIVVLEYSTDPELQLPGQTGPTITKWYNKECSLVDIPGNRNALTKLYDAQENELNLVDLNAMSPVIGAGKADVTRQLYELLQLQGADSDAIVNTVSDLVAKAANAELENKTLRNEKQALLSRVEEMNNASRKFEITALLDRALEDKKVTTALSKRLAADYAENPEGLKALLAAMPAYRSIAEHLAAGKPDDAEQQWQWDDYEKNDPTGKKLKELRANDAARYQELFHKKFGAANN